MELSTGHANKKQSLSKTRSIWKMLGPFATASRRTLNCHSPGVATVACCLRIDVHNNDDNAWQRGPLWPHRMGPINYFSYRNIFCHQIYSFYWWEFRPYMQQLLLQYLLWFKNYNRLKLKLKLHFSKWTSNNCDFDVKSNSKYTIWTCQWIIMCGMLCWNTINDTRHSWPTSRRAENCSVDDTEWFASRVHW